MKRLSDQSSAGFDCVIDVRAPSEFAEDHLPGAINLPVLSDEERARVGTIYVQDSPFRARKLGAALVAKNASSHLEGVLADKDGSWRPLIYCWRGGQRSGSFASILDQIGWRVSVLDGGYRTYRRLVTQRLYDEPVGVSVVLLDGNTGTGKTEILKQLERQGIQVLDLEGLANHRGSVLGGQGAQPSQKSFESALAQQIEEMDPTKPLVVEAESSRIGQLNLPPQIFAAMRDAPRITVSAPLAARAAFLARHYADLSADLDQLTDNLNKLIPIQGRERVQDWVSLAHSQNFKDLAGDLILKHYDPRYAKARQKKPINELARIETETLSANALGSVVRDICDLLADFTAD